MKTIPPQLESKRACSPDHVPHDGVRAPEMPEGLADLFLIHFRAQV